MYDFYSADDITRAKDRIVGDVAKLQIDGLPRISSRRDSANRSRLEIDDMFSLITVLDEHLTKLIDKLPSYAATDSDRVSSSRLDEGDIHILLSKLEKMQDDI